MRGLVILVLLAGCRSLLGIDNTTKLTDAQADIDAPTCFGTFAHLCLPAPLSDNLVFMSDVAIDTDTSNLCVKTFVNGVEVCAVGKSAITILPGVTVAGIGSKPLVLVADM